MQNMRFCSDGNFTARDATWSQIALGTNHICL